MGTIVEIIKNNTEWLYFKIIETPIFFFDFWTIVHFWSGGVLLTLISNAKWKHKWLILFTILFIYEIIEIIVVYCGITVFRAEIIKDQFTDIIVGMGGGYFFDKWLNFYSSKDKKLFTNFLKNPDTHIVLFTAVTIAFLWVGFYGYEYNVAILNFPSFNYITFLLWSTGMYLMLAIYNRLSVRIKKKYSIIMLWAIYFAGLCIFEYTFYHILGLKESGNHDHKALVFNIIHGTTTLHIFYLLVPFIAVAIYTPFNKLFKNTLYNVASFKEYPHTQRFTIMGNENSYKKALVAQASANIKYRQGK